MIERVAVLGAGAWGTALATVAVRPGRHVALWCRDGDRARAMTERRENREALPGVRLDPAILPTADAASALRAAEIAILAVPAQSLRATLAALPPFRPDMPVVICAKGLEIGTGLTMAAVVAACRPATPVAVLSGPSFASDVGGGLPTAVTLAARDLGLARALAEALAQPTFRLYHSDDLTGVEIGGAAKNVFAIACGVATGMALGASAVAALLARAFAELARFAEAEGARPETLMGLSGLGDLVLTCSSPQSRNFSYGVALGHGQSPAAAVRGRLVEGAATAGVLCGLARAKGIEMPIAESVAALVAGSISPTQAREALLARPSRAEIPS